MCWHLSCTCLSGGHVTSLPSLEWFGMLSWRSGSQYDMKISFSVANGASLWGYSLPHEQSYASIGELWKKLVSFYLYVWACCVVSYLSHYLCKFPFLLPLRKHTSLTRSVLLPSIVLSCCDNQTNTKLRKGFLRNN